MTNTDTITPAPSIDVANSVAKVQSALLAREVYLKEPNRTAANVSFALGALTICEDALNDTEFAIYEAEIKANR